MEKQTEFDAAKKQFNEQVKELAKRIIRKMDELGINELGDYVIEKVRFERCVERYLALRDGKGYLLTYKSLMAENSHYFCYGSDVWITAATIEEKMQFCKDVRSLLEQLQAKRDAIQQDMVSAVQAAEKAINGVQEIEEKPVMAVMVEMSEEVDKLDSAFNNLKEKI